MEPITAVVDPQTKEMHFWAVQHASRQYSQNFNRATVEALVSLGILEFNRTYDEDGYVIHYYRRAS